MALRSRINLTFLVWRLSPLRFPASSALRQSLKGMVHPHSEHAFWLGFLQTTLRSGLAL